MSEIGIRQFLDIGAGIPTSPNVHEVAQQYHPDARVVYVDNDPVVFLHSEALMPKDSTTAVVPASVTCSRPARVIRSCWLDTAGSFDVGMSPLPDAIGARR